MFFLFVASPPFLLRKNRNTPHVPTITSTGTKSFFPAHLKKRGPPEKKALLRMRPGTAALIRVTVAKSVLSSIQGCVNRQVVGSAPGGHMPVGKNLVRKRKGKL